MVLELSKEDTKRHYLLKVDIIHSIINRAMHNYENKDAILILCNLMFIDKMRNLDETQKNLRKKLIQWGVLAC